VEWYFGGEYPHNDLDCEDWRSRDRMWDQTRIAADFFNRYLPFADMKNADALMSGCVGHCLAKPGEIYAAYLVSVGSPVIDFGKSEGRYSVFWLDPREGGGLQKGTVESVPGEGRQAIGRPVKDLGRDWVVLVRKYPKP